MSISIAAIITGINLVDEATVTGGSFTTGQPLSNIQNMDMWKYTRFSALTPDYILLEYADTKTFQIFAALKHSLSATGLWRIRVADTLANVTGTPDYDSGWVKITPESGGYGTLEWGEFVWGDVLSNQYDTILNRQGIHIADDSVEGKFVRFDFDDQLENEFGYVQMARLWAGSFDQPSFNASYGAKVLPIDKTKVKTSESGVRTYGTRYLRRGLALDFELTEAELMSIIYGPLYMVNGKAGEVLGILQPTRPETFQFQAVYGNIQDLQDAVHSTYGRMTTSFIVDERV